MRLQSLIESSKNGHHLLFLDIERLKNCLGNITHLNQITDESSQERLHLIVDKVDKSQDQGNCVSELKQKDYELFVHAYFYSVFQFIDSGQ